MLSSLPKDPKALFITLSVFIGISLAGAFFIHLSNTNYLHNQKQLISSTARSHASDIERSLSLAFTSTQILAHQIEVDQNKVDFFTSYAKNIMESIPGIDNIQLAPNGIIRHIYPLEGNEAAIGLDVLNHPRYREAARLAIKEQRMISVGPVKLVQGGTAVISRTPIFITKSNVVDKEQFWGFASALILLEPLLVGAGVHNLEDEGYAIELTRTLSGEQQPVLFYKSDKALDEDTKVQAEITLPTGSWLLSLSHDVNSITVGRTYSMSIITFILACSASFGLYTILVRPKQLQKEVDDKTQELKELAYKDPLTSLPNRRYLNDFFPSILEAITSRNNFGAFIYFDLDNFKSINDSIGHDIGDQVLQEIAARLTNLAQHYKVVRLGGDEFAIVISSATNLDEIKQAALNVLCATQKTIKIEHREFKQSTSLGVALIPEHGSTLLSLMQCADVALYEAKRRGKNQYAIFDEVMLQNSINTHNEELALHQAIQQEELELYFQPQLNLALSRVIGAEALVRWNHPQKGLVSPDNFIPLAEESGLILELGRYVIRKSFEYQADRNQMGLYPILLHINLSSLQLSDVELVPFVEEMIHLHAIPGHYIGFEITETTLLTDLTQAQKTLECLKDLGICIAIDDFGTGFSSLGQLKNLPVDLLKIDRSFVRDLETDKDDVMMVEAIIAMAHKLDIMVVAEGVESAEHLAMLTEFQCDLGQGYFIARPIPASQFNQFPERLNQDSIEYHI